jgi:addiction module HigA family antidote
MGKLANNLQSFTPYHPGELVKDELEYRAIKQKDFAEKFNISYSVLNEVLNGKRNITSEFALVLEAALGIKADVLVRIQTDYNLDMARNSDKLQERLDNI